VTRPSLILSLLLLPSLARAEQAASPQDPEALLRAKTAAVKALMGKPADEARTKELRAMVAELVDYTELAKRSLKKRWDKRTEAEREEFSGLLKALIEKSYLEQVEKQPDFEVSWEEKRLLDDGARAAVRTVARSGETAVEIEYRLRRRETGWMAVDIVVDGVSMVRNYRRSFRKVIKKDGWQALIDKMKRKLAGEE